MLTTAPHLLTRRPSPTTAEFTVSTQPPLTLPYRLLLLLVNAARLALALSVFLVAYAKWTTLALYTTTNPYLLRSSPVPPGSGLLDRLLAGLSSGLSSSSNSSVDRALAVLHHTLQALLHGPAGRWALTVARSVPFWALLPLLAAAAYASVVRLHARESLLVLRGLGVQTSSTPATVLGGAVTRFIPTEKIQDVLVAEAFRGFGVRYYLTVVVEDEDELVVVFPKLLPRRDVVERVWRGARRCLFEEREGEGAGVGSDGSGLGGSGSGNNNNSSRKSARDLGTEDKRSGKKTKAGDAYVH
ncbi:GPI-GlcNAc transferase complex, PIG-H component-domain-containing protein [Xylariales sp. PMI_506]|nr:GPI-GlcNAc transferase complex, PIG-H component-domain-containing protein [Xylariales sp. PMI_506]